MSTVRELLCRKRIEALDVEQQLRINCANLRFFEGFLSINRVIKYFSDISKVRKSKKKLGFCL